MNNVCNAITSTVYSSFRWKSWQTNVILQETLLGFGGNSQSKFTLFSEMWQLQIENPHKIIEETAASCQLLRNVNCLVPKASNSLECTKTCIVLK